MKLVLLSIGFLGFLVMSTGMAMMFRAARGLAANEGDHPRLRKAEVVVGSGALILVIVQAGWFLGAAIEECCE